MHDTHAVPLMQPKHTARHNFVQTHKLIVFCSAKCDIYSDKRYRHKISTQSILL